jgi:phenylalanyl-tRNA synthetase beta chain
MRIPLIWLKNYIQTDKSAVDLAKSFTALGLMLDKPIGNDILDLEHRMDRSDWLSIIGCARDLAAMEGLKLNLPHIDTTQTLGQLPQQEKIAIKVECPENVRRFNTRIFKNIKVKESPQWIKEHLSAYGMPPINNIVDITNFVMIEYGQPMHAQDIATFEKNEIVIRNAKEGEQITTLDGTLVELDPTISVLTQRDKPIAIMGIVGGVSTAVTEKTTDIILDAGNYNQVNIRNTSRKLKIQNETVLRTDKFLHPHLTQVAIERTTALILEIAGGEVYENEDYYPNPIPPKEMTLTMARLKQISGMDFEKKKTEKILRSLGYKIVDEIPLEVSSYKLEIPYFRTDIEVEDDIISDILRISNYKNIPAAPLDKAPPQEITPTIYTFEDECRDALVNLGLHEHITNPLVSEKKSDDQVTLENALSSEQNALRTTLYETLHPVAEIYKKHGIEKAEIFEIGKTYHKHENSYKEIRTLEVVYMSAKSIKEVNDAVKGILSGLFHILGIQNARYTKSESGTSINQDNLTLGELKIDSFTLYTKELLKAQKHTSRVISEFINSSREDITLTAATTTPVGPIFEKIETFDETIQSAKVVDEYLDGDKKSISIRIAFEGGDKQKVTEIKNKLIGELEKEFDVLT